MNKISVALIFGGKSSEHEVSINSAKNIAAAIDKTKFNLVTIGISKEGSWYFTTALNKIAALKDDSIDTENFHPISFDMQGACGKLINKKTQKPIDIDIVFPIIHGTFGEDGCLQGFFKMLNIPFVGCSVLSSAAGMDKDIMKQIFSHAKVPNAPFLLLRPWQNLKFKDIVDRLGLPFFIKPANAGSSVGVHKIKNESEFSTQLSDSFTYDTKVIAEKFIRGKEIEISVLGLNHTPEVSEPGEIRPTHEFYTYEAKYLDQNGAQTIIPATISDKAKAQVKQLAKAAYTAINATGFARMDFFVTENDEVFINEINTLPGFTNISMYPKMWEASGLSYSSLITKLIELGLEQHRIDQSLKRDFDQSP